MKGERITVKRFFSVGRGMGPETSAPVRCAVSTICRADWSRILWSNAFIRMRIRCLATPLLLDAGDDAGADGLAALADGEAQALLEGHGGDQLDAQLDVVPGHHHLRALGQLHRPGDVGGADVELRAVP